MYKNSDANKYKEHNDEMRRQIRRAKAKRHEENPKKQRDMRPNMIYCILTKQLKQSRE